MKRYNVVLIGCGHMGEVHLEHIYYKEYINERNTHNGTMFLKISKDGESLTQTIYSPDKEDTVYYVDLTEKQKVALKNISKYYIGSQRQEIIMIKEQMIR